MRNRVMLRKRGHRGWETEQRARVSPWLPNKGKSFLHSIGTVCRLAFCTEHVSARFQMEGYPIWGRGKKQNTLLNSFGNINKFSLMAFSNNKHLSCRRHELTHSFGRNRKHDLLITYFIDTEWSVKGLLPLNHSQTRNYVEKPSFVIFL